MCHFYHVMKKKQRLSKVLAAAGVASRRASEAMIFEGRIQVNDETTLIPQTMVDDSDTITVDGVPLGKAEPKVCYLLNKPKGYICSNIRRSGHSKLVLDLFPGEEKRLFTVGRLDKDTAGLLIVTNDGHFANRVIHPSSNIHKEYLAKTDHEITHEHLVTISKGVRIDRKLVKPVNVKKVRKGTVRVTVSEGKKHEVRLLLMKAGLKVRELTRIRLGGLNLGGLPLGTWRPMTQREKDAIFGDKQ